MKKISFISLNSELGAGKKGAAMGYGAIKEAAIKYKSLIFSNNETDNIPEMNDRMSEETPFIFAKRINYILELYHNISDTLSTKLKIPNLFPVIISGDHSTAGGSIAGIRKAYPDARIGVIWFDAHADIHSPYTTPSGNLHGMPIAAALGLDNIEEAIHQPDHKTIDYWEKLKNTANKNPMIKSEDIVFVGLRATESQEDHLIEKYSIKTISVDDLRENGIHKTQQEIINHLKLCDYIYISFDVDCLDPTISEGTGTPVAHGLYQNEASGLLNELMTDPRVCCLEFTEINPLLDQENKMAEIALEILESALKKI